MTILYNARVTTGITAAVGSTQATGVALNNGLNVIATCANAGDAVTLPAGSAPGAVVQVKNLGAASADVFPNVGGKINALSVDAAFAVAAAASATLVCIDTTGAGLLWVSV